MLNTTNQQIANTIISQLCNNDAYCMQLGNIRLNTFLDDNLFNQVLANLTNRRFYQINFVVIGTQDVPGVGRMSAVKLQYMDVITGESGESGVNVIPNLLEQNPIDYNRVLHLFDPGLFYLGKVSNNIIIYNSTVGGYSLNITDPNNSNNGGGASGGGGGYVYNDPDRTNEGSSNESGTTKQITSSNPLSIIPGLENFNLNSLILPGLAVALYLILKK